MKGKDETEIAKGLLLELLLKKGALRVAKSQTELFLLKSGRYSPYFVNCGLLTDGESQSTLKRVYANHIYKNIREGLIPEFQFIFGPSYKGITLACLSSEGLWELFKYDVRYMYDRKEKKQYGDTLSDKNIIGSLYFHKGDTILLIDDVITTGETKFESINKLECLGNIKIVGLVVAVDRQERSGNSVDIGNTSAVQNIEKLGIPIFPILNASDIFENIKGSLSIEMKDYWVTYFKQYGVAELIG